MGTAGPRESQMVCHPPGKRSARLRKAILEEPPFECGYDEVLRREVIQVAAVAVAWLEAIARQQGELHDGT